MSKKRKTKTRSKAKRPAKMTTRQAMLVATNARKTVEERVEAMAMVPLAVCESDDHLQSVLGTLRDQDEPLEVRLAALQAIQAASFSGVEFESCRKDYIATLRRVARDPHPELRQRVLGILAREKDGYAQKKLLEGLENAEKALLPPEKALQLLSYDVHADAYEAARRIAKQPSSEEARREALRLLSADARASRDFEKILLNKEETTEIRQIAATALHSLSPGRLHKHAKEIVLDKSENEDVQATSLTALAYFGDEGLVEDKALVRHVRKLKTEAPARVKRSARQFLKQHRED